MTQRSVLPSSLMEEGNHWALTTGFHRYSVIMLFSFHIIKTIHHWDDTQLQQKVWKDTSHTEIFLGETPG